MVSSRLRVTVVGLCTAFVVLTMFVYVEELKYMLTTAQRVTDDTIQGKGVSWGAPGGDECASRGSQHHRVRREVCPFRDPGDPDSLATWDRVSPGIAWVWRRQHSGDCSQERFFRRTGISGIGMAATTWAVVNNMWKAFGAGRIFTLDLVKGQGDNIMARDPSCGAHAHDLWRCYFEELTNCDNADIRSIKDAVESKDMGPKPGEDWPQRLVNNPNKHWAPWPGPPKTYLPWKYSQESESALHTFVYALRLRPNIRLQVADSLTRMFDSVPDFNPARTIGMPLRGSDKCAWGAGWSQEGHGEMSCMSFAQYMEWAEKIRKEYPSMDTIILTSEDYHNYIEPHGNYTDRWRFVLNHDDVQQGIGKMSSLKETSHVLVSSMTALHAQLRSSVLLLHSASNWHMMIYRFLTGGCAIVQTKIIFVDGQPDWPGCTTWDKSKRCEEHMLQRYNDGIRARKAWEKAGKPADRRPIIPDLVK